MRSGFGYRTSIPSITAQKQQTKQLSFKDGVDTYKDNDDLKPTELLVANDARMVRIGRYKTRKGIDRYSVPLGEAINAQSVSTTGTDDQPVGQTTIDQPLTITADGRLTRVDINLKTLDGSQGTLLIEVYTDDDGFPGDLLDRSSIAASAVGSGYQYLPCYFVRTPLLHDGDTVHIVVKGQSASVSDYAISSTTTITDGQTSVDGGVSWTPAEVGFNVKLYTATDGGVKGLIRAYRPNGQKETVFFADTSVYSVDDTTGATTAIKTGLNASATKYRARMVQDAIYWVNGYEKPYKYDFTEVTQITDSPYVPSLIEEHVGLLFFVDAEDKTRLYYTNFGEYDTFTSTDFIYVPAPKSYDSLTALAPLNGVLFIFANRNKFQLYGTDNATFSLNEAPDQGGTFSQESLVYDQNFIFYANETGVWQFNGTEAKNIAQAFLPDYLAISNKQTINLEVFNNRLYIFYTPAGQADNSECFVYNMLLGLYEGKDLNTPVGRTFGRQSQDNLFIQASHRVGALYYGELDSNDHCNLGDQLQYEIATRFEHFDTPAQRKRVPKWRPVFPSVTNDYAIQVGYSKDLSTDVTWTDVSLAGAGPRYNTGLRYNTGIRFGGTTIVEPTQLYIPGTFKRLQRRYSHVAAREPVEVDSEVMTVETQRII